MAARTHALRQQVDAILVGAETVRQDNPQLTARSVSEIFCLDGSRAD